MIGKQTAIGSIGESLFRHLCSKEGIEASKPDNDVHSWDFFVQFSLRDRDRRDLPLDRIEPIAQCLVQVKTTKSKSQRPKIRMKLSNWQELAMNSLPAFIFVAVLNERDDAEVMYLSHIGQDRISQVLARLRSHEGSASPLHKTSMFFQPTLDEELMVGTSDKPISNRIIQYVGQSTTNYATAKREILESVGYEETRTMIKFRCRIEDFVNASIGIHETVRVSNMRLYDDIRFGKPAAEQHHSAADLKITGIKTDVDILIDDGRSPPLTVRGVMRLPPIQALPKNEVEKYFKAKIETDIGTLTILPDGKLEIRLSVGFDVVSEYTLIDMETKARVLLALDESSTKPVRLRVFAKDHTVMETTIGTDASQVIKTSIPFPLIHISESILDLLYVARVFSIPLETRVLPNYEALSHSSLIKEMRLFLDPTMRQDLMLSFVVDGPIPERSTVAVPRVLSFTLNNLTYSVSGLYVGRVSRDPTKTDEEYYALAPAIRAVDKRVDTDGSEHTQFEIYAILLQQAVRQYDEVVELFPLRHEP